MAMNVNDLPKVKWKLVNCNVRIKKILKPTVKVLQKSFPYFRGLEKNVLKGRKSKVAVFREIWTIIFEVNDGYECEWFTESQMKAFEL